MVKITLTDKEGNVISQSGISDEKAKHITDTNQWNYVFMEIFADVELNTKKEKE